MTDTRTHCLSTGIYGTKAKPFVTGPLAFDHAGVQYAVAHQDIEDPEGVPFWTPAIPLRVIRNFIGPGYGWYCLLSTLDDSGVIVFEHADSEQPGLTPGWVLGPGSYLGRSGGVPGKSPGVDSVHSSGAHLHVAYNGPFKSAIVDAYGPSVLIEHIGIWAYTGKLHDGGPTFQRGHTLVMK